MRWTDQNGLLLESDEWHLLLWNVLNEVLNGFRIRDFAGAIGAPQEKVMSMFGRLYEVPKHYASCTGL